MLGLLFYRFISENLTEYLNRLEHEAGETEFNYAELSDEDAEFGREWTLSDKGFFILPSELFVNVRAIAKTDENLNETLESVFKNIEGSAVGTDSEDDLKGLFDDLDVNSTRLGNSVAKRNATLVKLLEAIGDLPLGDWSDNSIDVFGDAYEYLMGMYASSAGKSGGEYYTPQEVSELLARITVVGKTEVNKVYDPAVGSGSLLLKIKKVLGKGGVRNGYFGQEIKLTTYNLARINMFLHNVNYADFNIALGDTLTDPKHWDDEPFEAIVSNPHSLQSYCVALYTVVMETSTEIHGWRIREARPLRSEKPSRWLPEDFSNLVQREATAGIRNGELFLLKPDGFPDLGISSYLHSSSFLRLSRSTQVSYTKDLRTHLNFLYSQNKDWRDCTTEDFEDYEYWRRRDEHNPSRISGAKFSRELAACRRFYEWQVRAGNIEKSPILAFTDVGTTNQAGIVVPLRPKNARNFRVKWLTPDAFLQWKRIGLMGYGLDGRHRIA